VEAGKDLDCQGSPVKGGENATEATVDGGLYFKGSPFEFSGRKKRTCEGNLEKKGKGVRDAVTPKGTSLPGLYFVFKSKAPELLDTVNCGKRRNPVA